MRTPKAVLVRQTFIRLVGRTLVLRRPFVVIDAFIDRLKGSKQY